MVLPFLNCHVQSLTIFRLLKVVKYLVEGEVLDANQPTINQYEVLWSTGSDVGIITARTIIVH